MLVATRTSCLVLLLLASLAGSSAASDPTAVAEITGAQLEALTSARLSRLALLACHDDDCQPIPFQMDERTADGWWALPHGPSPIHDDSPGILDRDDLLLWLAADAGEPLTDPARLPPHTAAAAIETAQPGSTTPGWVYLVACKESPPRSPLRYVDYDPDRDLMLGRRMALGFGNGVPDRLVPRNEDGSLEENLLDRFKVRARATLFWGLLRFHRDEADFTTELVGWHAGPIRVIRYQRQRIRLGWGIRSPVFSLYTFLHPDFAELPLGLRLNYRPTFFFGDIRVDVLLDFRDLDGWSFSTLDGEPFGIGTSAGPIQQLQQAGDWFFLHGPGMTLAQVLYVDHPLQPARRRLLYRYSAEPNPPESVAGERPAIGYRFDRWDDVGAGHHALKAVAYSLPANADVEAFARTRAAVAVRVHPIR